MNKYIRSLLITILAFCFLALFAPMTVRADEPEARTLSISTPDEFLEFSESCRLDTYSVNLSVSLEADLDLSGTDFRGVPIFSGHFDGNHHTIRGINLSHDGSVLGLFRYLTETASVKDLNLEGLVLPQGSRSSVGALAGSNSGHIKNCTFNGTLSGSEQIGGLVGVNTLTGILEHCTVKGNVSGDHFIGGMAGLNLGIIRNCVNRAQINTSVQQNTVEISDITLDTLSNSEAPNTVTDIGGIAGSNIGVIRSCRNYANVGYAQIGYNIGGISGSQTGYIFKCKNSGSISGRKEVGGIAGQMEPVIRIEYSKDTLQILQEQLNTMESLTNRASSDAQASAHSISTQFSALKDQTSASTDAVEQLIYELEQLEYHPEDFDPEDPQFELEMDGIWAAESNLSTQIGNMGNTLDNLKTSTQTMGDTLYRDITSISNQIDAMSQTLNHAEENLGGSIRDISDEDTDADVTGKVDSCINEGAILADANAGGIAGAITFENDLDPESDVELSGNLSLNSNSELRAVILKCQNKADVTAKKQHAGGILGWQTMGLVKDCLNLGNLLSENADFVGGITGNANGFIRNNASKCELRGKTYVGGIAGQGTILTDNRSMVNLTVGTEKTGAILGFWSETDRVEEESPLKDNFYPILSTDYGAIDGISYFGLAQSLSLPEFLNLDDLKNEFGTVTVTFVYNENHKQERFLNTGDCLKEEWIPEIPEQEGKHVFWENLTWDPIYFDTVFTLSDTALRNILESETHGRDNRPVVLVQGNFSPESELHLTPANKSPNLALEKNEVFLEAWNLEITGSYDLTGTRYLLPEQLDATNISIEVCDASGEWRKIPYVLDGSYLTFQTENDISAFALIQEISFWKRLFHFK